MQVRPLGPHGKLQVAKDLAELQLAVGQNLYPLEQLNRPFRSGSQPATSTPEHVFVSH
jgi:hypothetical protein